MSRVVEGPGLSRERIVRSALTFIEERGLKELTMRELGGSLGVEAMSLYRYLPSREALLDAVVEHVVDDLYGDPGVLLAPRHGWQDFLVRLAHGVRRIAQTYPQTFPLVASRPPAAPWVRPPLRSLRWIEAFLDALTSAGFSDRAAVDAYRAFSSFLLGHLLLEVAGRGADIAVIGEPTLGRDAQQQVLAAYPVLERMSGLMAQDRADAEFEESLENLLDRLDRLVAVRA
jgi:AcrR family transcriptional regulator